MKSILVSIFFLILSVHTTVSQSETELKLKAAMQEVDQQRLLATANQQLALQAEEKVKHLELKVMYMRYIAIANELAERAVEIQDKELAGLLSVLSYNFFDKETKGSSFNNKAYTALSNSIKKFSKQQDPKELTKLLGDDIRSTTAVLPNKSGTVQAEQDGTLKLVVDGMVKMTLAGHQAQVDQIRFNNAGTLMITAGKDNTIRIWNLKQLNLRPLVITESAAISKLTISPDDKQIIYIHGSSQKTVKAQPLDIEEMAASLCNSLSRNLTTAEWQTYVAADLAYEPVCKNLPAGNQQ